MNGISISIVHPAFEQFKRLAWFMHIVAAAMILAQAFHGYHLASSSPIFSWCLAIVAIDIFILVLSNRNLLQELPRVNLIFRSIECLVFISVAVVLILRQDWVMGGTVALVSIGYAFLFYCEKQAASTASVRFNHTGITISGIPESRFLIWTKIQKVLVRYDSICIDTSDQKILYYPLHKKLDYEELEQIHEFCRHYLGKDHS